MRDLQHDARELEARGHQVVKAAIRSGQAVVARTPAEVRQLGLAAAQGRLPQALGEMAGKRMTSQSPPKASQPTPKKPAAVTTKKGLPESSTAKALTEQGRAALSGFVDEVTFGGADRALSAIDAVTQGGLEGYGDRYRSELNSRFAEDAADQKNFALARTAGQIGGAGVSLVALGGVGGATLKALANAPRVSRAARLATAVDKRFVNPQGLASMFATQGAVTGVSGQVVEDLATGQISGLPKYAAAAAGGAIEGAVSRYAGATAGGGAGGASTSLMGDIAEGKDLSLDRALDAAQMGGTIGGIVSNAVALRAADLPNWRKGRLGEAMTRHRLQAQNIAPAEQPRYRLENGRHAIPDFAVDPLNYFDAKLGPNAKLTRNQELAEQELLQLGGTYKTDYWKFRDVGNYASSGSGTLGEFNVDPEAPRLGI